MGGGNQITGTEQLESLNHRIPNPPYGDVYLVMKYRSMPMSHTTAFKAVIYYKFVIAGVLAAIALSLLSTAYNPSKLDDIADSGLFESHFWLIDQGLDQFLTLDQKKQCKLAES